MSVHNTIQSADELYALGERAWQRQRPREALAYFLASAQRGNKLAPEIIGNFYDVGQGTEPDPELAKQWYRKAYSRAESRLAAFALGLIYRDEHNVRLAVVWLKRAIALGYGDAHYELARMYAAKPRTRPQAIELLRQLRRVRFTTPDVRVLAAELMKSLQNDLESNKSPNKPPHVR